MNRREYLDELNTHLMSLPAEERENAVLFYEEYFEDAGIENEQEVINELGKPYALAKSIICEQSAYSKSLSYAQYRASKQMNSVPKEADSEIDTTPDIMPSQQEDIKPHTQYTAYNQDTVAEDNSYEAYKEAYTGSGNTTYTKTSGNNSNIVTLIITIIVGIPALLLLICIFASLTAASVVCLIVAVIMLAVGLFSGMGIAAVGISLLLAGIGFLLSVPAVIGFGKVIPSLLKTIINTFKNDGGENR